MSIFAKAKKARENKKGFTLVELIVVLVILAILAAILVPALLGWIDKAREKQYVLAARNVMLATQTKADEYYAVDTKPTDIADRIIDNDVDEIQEIADVEELEITSVTPKGSANSTKSMEESHEAYIVSGMEINFAADGKTVTAKLQKDAGSWTITTEKKQ